MRLSLSSRFSIADSNPKMAAHHYAAGGFDPVRAIPNTLQRFSREVSGVTTVRFHMFIMFNLRI
jgi:hypothetical protein